MIEIRECSKSFSSVKAVQNVSMDIGEREVFGLVGSNGAGKSTLLRMTAGVIKPDHGEIHIDGIPVFDNKEAKSNLFFIESSFDSCYGINGCHKRTLWQSLIKAVRSAFLARRKVCLGPLP